MQEKLQNKSQGSLQRALLGQYEFDVKEVLQEGWQITQRDKSTMLQGIGFIFALAVMVMLIAQVVASNKGIDFNEPSFRLGTEVVLMILVAPFAAALMMMGINLSIGGKNKMSDLFYFLNRTFSIVLVSLMISAIVQIGLMLFIVPGLYLVIATGFSIPLMLDKGLLPSRAILTSIKVVNHQWQKFVALYGVFVLLLVLVMFTFGIALLWVAPFYYNVKGLLYRDIFGVGNEHSVLMPVAQATDFDHNGQSGNSAHSTSKAPSSARDDYFDA